MRRRLAPTLTAVVAAASLAGCGGGRSTTSTQAPGPKLLRGPQSCTPPLGQGTTGACAPKHPSAARKTLSGPFFVDVSYFQGTINWTTAKRYISGAVVRVADGSFTDPAFARNWRALRALHVWHAAYFFLRPGDCRGEARRAVGLVRAQGGFDSGPLIADAEVPLNYGCAAAFEAEAHRLTGKPEVIYTAPGTWAGGPHGGSALWVATYGSSPGCVWTCSRVGWQYTDGSIGPSPHCTPGIGCDDRSTDTGMTRLGGNEAATRAALRRHRAKVAVLHRLIERHRCRPGQRATPPTYHRVCGRWLAHGQREHRIVKRLERQLA